MIKKCNGCGAILQDQQVENEGYIKILKDDTILCERCFRIQHYGDYKKIVKEKIEIERIISQIPKTDLILFVVDLFDIPKDLKETLKKIKNPIILIYSKRDILPKTLFGEKLLKYSQTIGLNYLDQIIISSYKNYHFDELYEMIKQYKTSNTVYVIGYTNAGKSSMLNRLIYHYSDFKQSLTTSMLPSTTLNTVSIPLESFYLIDTPGLLEEGRMSEYVEIEALKKILPRKEIKPLHYQIKNKQTILIDQYASIYFEDTVGVTFYCSSSLKVNRVYHELKNHNFECHKIHVKANEDVVIKGLLFFHTTRDTVVSVNTLKGVHVYVRPMLIGKN